MSAHTSTSTTRNAKRLACIAFVSTILAAHDAFAHPHPGGVVVLRNGSVVVGDILGMRLLLIDPHGVLREVPNVGDIRGLTSTADGMVHGVSWQRGAGVWNLATDGSRRFLLEGFEGFVAAADHGTFNLAPINEHGLGQSVEILHPNGDRSILARLADITAIIWDQGTTYVAAGSSVYKIEAAGTVESLATDVGTGLYSMVMGPNGLIVACHDQRQVVEIAPNGARRTLLTSDSPWGPTGVAIDKHDLFVVELAQHSCCFKGPRIRRMKFGGTATTLLAIDDGKHFHFFPSNRPFEWMVGFGLFATTVIALPAMRHLWARRYHNGRKDYA